MANQRYTFDQGLVTARKPTLLNDGELQRATGCEYREGTPELHKLQGRTSTGTNLGAIVTGIKHLQYDTADDVLLAVTAAGAYEGTPSTDPDFGSAVATGFNWGGVPTFAQTQDIAVVCNGIDPPKYRDASGTWYTAMYPPSGAITFTKQTVTGSAQERPTEDSTTFGANNYENIANSYDIPANGGSSTFALGDVYRHGTGASAPPSTVAIRTLGLAFTGAATATDKVLKISMDGSAPTALANSELTRGFSHQETTVYYTLTGATTLQTYNILKIADTYGVGSYDFRQAPLSIRVPSGTTQSNVKLYFRTIARQYPITSDQGPYENGYGHGNSYNRVFDVWLADGGSLAVPFDYDLTYCYTELYTDSNGVEHESAPSSLQTLTADGADLYGVTLTMPTTATNSRTTHLRVYRSVMEEGGGWPLLYKIDEITLGTTKVYDFFEDIGVDGTSNDPRVAPDTPLIPSVGVYSAEDGTNYYATPNTPPPNAKLAIPFQGCMVYLSDSRDARYSMPFVLDSAAMEHVPQVYTLSFETPYNDIPVTASTVNGGKTLLIYFTRYTLQINYIPQATDAGTFDQRISEYVSNTRGCVGLRAVCEFTLPSGQTLAAAVDAVGLWVTDGISTVQDWSRDLDWSTIPVASRATVVLVDNTEKRRLELLYVDADGNNQEYHFFYARMKRDGDGNMAPLITGPHPTNVGVKTFSYVDGEWLGWGGDSTAFGNVYNENTGDADESYGYGDFSTTIIPFDVESGDKYMAGLGGAHIVEFAYPEFHGTGKTFDVIGTFTKDGGDSVTVTKTFASATQKKLYWHRYADRHSIRFSDLTNTAAPSLVAYEVTANRGGDSRNR